MKTFPKCACGRSLPILDVPGVVFCCCGKEHTAEPSRSKRSLDPEQVFGGVGRSPSHQVPDSRREGRPHA